MLVSAVTVHIEFDYVLMSIHKEFDNDEDLEELMSRSDYLFNFNLALSDQMVVNRSGD